MNDSVTIEEMTRVSTSPMQIGLTSGSAAAASSSPSSVFVFTSGVTVEIVRASTYHAGKSPFT